MPDPLQPEQDQNQPRGPIAERWAQWKSALEGRVRQRVTFSGVMFTVAIVLVAFAAFVSANNLLFLLLAAMLGTLLVSGFVSRLGLAGLELDLILPDHISARRKLIGRIAIRNAKRWMPSFSIRLTGSGAGLSSNLYLPLIPGGSTAEESVQLFFPTRGIHSDNSFRCATRFPFGFTERHVNVTLRREVLVYPCVDPQSGFEELLAQIQGDIASPYRGRGSDFYRIRPYEVLESARHVDWRATAHTGELQVREFAREQETLVWVFLDIDVHDSQREWFERAVDCCAFLAWRLLERDARLRFQTQNFDLQVPEEGDAYTILRYLATVAPARRAVPVVPRAENTLQIVFTADPAHLRDKGWEAARLVGPVMLAPADPKPGEGTAVQSAHGHARSGEDIDHGGRQDQR